MSEYYYLNRTEQQRLQARRAADPNAPLTSRERSILRQREAEGKAEVSTEAAKRQAARDAAVPAHEQRPINAARIVYERRLAMDRPGNRQPATVLESLAKAADERDREIDAEMEAKRQQYLRDNDPSVQGAIQYGEAAVKLATSGDQGAWARLVGIAKEGDVKEFWAGARDLNAKIAEREKAKQIEAATERSAADAAWTEQKERTDKAVAELQASMAEMAKSLEST